MEMNKWFKLPVDCELRISGDKTNEHYPDTISFHGHNVLTGHHVEKVEIAINSYDSNQALITKQAEQIKVLREALIDADAWMKVIEDCDKPLCNKIHEALEATKD